MPSPAACRRALKVMHRITEIAPPKKDADIPAALEAIRSESPSVNVEQHYCDRPKPNGTYFSHY